MSYCIEYSPEHKKRYPRARNKTSNLRIAAICLMTVALIVVFCSGSVRDFLSGWLLPGDPETTEKALIGFVSDLREGESFYGAAQAFCRQIIESSSVYDEA